MPAGHEVCKHEFRAVGVEQNTRTDPGAWRFHRMTSQKLKSLPRSFHALGSFNLWRTGCVLRAKSVCVLLSVGRTRYEDLPRVECTRGAEKDLYPLTTSSYSWHLPQAANSKSAIENSQSSDNPKVGRLVFNSSGDQGWSKVQWGYWGTLSSLMWILTSFMQNELWVQLWTQLHSQPGYRREYLWMTLGLSPYKPIFWIMKYTWPHISKSDFQPVWPSQGPPCDWQPSALIALLHLWQHLSPPSPFPPLYTGPVPQPVTQGHFASLPQPKS